MGLGPDPRVCVRSRTSLCQGSVAEHELLWGNTDLYSLPAFGFPKVGNGIWPNMSLLDHALLGTSEMFTYCASLWKRDCQCSDIRQKAVLFS